MEIGRLLIIFGLVLVIAGIAFSLGLRWPKLPGDIIIQRDNFSFFFPLASSVVISIILTILINLFLRK